MKESFPEPGIYLSKNINPNNPFHIMNKRTLNSIKEFDTDIALNISDNVFVVFDLKNMEIVQLFKDENEIKYRSDFVNYYVYSTDVFNDVVKDCCLCR